MGSDSTWEMENKIQRGTVEEKNMFHRGKYQLILWIPEFYVSDCVWFRYMTLLHNTVNVMTVIHNSPVSAKMFLSKRSKQNDTPCWCAFVVSTKNSGQDQFHNLSDCVLCSLPLFLMVTDSSRKPPLTPFGATSCGETWWGVCSLQRCSVGHKTGIKLDQTWACLGHLRQLAGRGPLWMAAFPWKCVTRWNPGWSWQRLCQVNLEVSDDPYWSDWWSYGF